MITSVISTVMLSTINKRAEVEGSDRKEAVVRGCMKSRI